jgi:hypothetical protein
MQGNNQVGIMRSGLGLILCVFSLLAGCGGGDGGAAPPPTSNNPPPPPAPPPVIGASGGTVTEISGASVVIPAGALAANTTIRIARDSTGAPAIPAGLTAAGSMYVITPHGGDFADGIEVRIPAPTVTLQPNQEFKLAKAQPDGEWLVLEDTVLDQGVLSAKVVSFSYFTPVIVTYLLPIAQAEPMRVTTSLTCSTTQCSQLIGAVTATYTVTTNNGQPPENCANFTLFIVSGAQLSYGSQNPINALPAGGGARTLTLNPSQSTSYRFGVGRRCSTYGSLSSFGYGLERSVNWAYSPAYPNLALLQMPEQVDVVEGLVANVDAVLSGGASEFTDPSYTVPTRTNRAVIEWERSDDSGSSWRVIARSYQDEANSLPSGVGVAWRYWSVRHGFVATASDQGALLRVHACYTPPTGAAPPCVTSRTTLLNVLQQSVSPAIVTAPRSVLVRTGQTASLSVSTTGAPAPTIQWQTRAANSSDAWNNVTAGTGATSANYSTAATSIADNGTQYRVLLTNAVGSTASTAVTVSVSDLDVAPSITTQPANLSVASGSDAVFAIDARGTEALSYQWSRNGVAIAGANSPVLRITGVTDTNAGSYAVTVSNSAGDADSNAAILSVTTSTPVVVVPSIVTQPTHLTVNAGSAASFAVGVSGTGPFGFQWRRDGVNITGATSAVFTLNSVGLPNAGAFSVVVSNSAGAIVSNNAVLDVTSAGAPVPPNITTQPATLILPLGGSSIMAVGATGTGPLSYQWYQDGTPIPFATQPVLNFFQVASNFVGSYTVTVTNSVSSRTSDPASLILLDAPVITQQPTAVTALEGGTATFSATASGSALRYQWSVNGTPISGATQSSYTTPSLVVANSGAVYSLLVYNAAGLEISQGAVLTVTAPVPPTVLQQPADVSIQAGTTAELCMAFGGQPPFSVQMSRWNGAAWAPVTGRFPITGNAPFCTLTPPLQLADSGAQFIFFASNAEGGPFEAMTRIVTITVTAAPVITSTTLVSRATSGDTANNRSQSPSLSTDGNLIAFVSDGTNLVPGFATTFGHAYVRNLQTGITTAVNQTVAGTESSTRVVEMKMAAGGRYVVFSSLAGDLVADDTNGSLDVFRRDLQTGTTERVNVLPNGEQLPASGNGVGDMRLDISADGRFIIYSSFFDMTGSGAALPNMTLFIRNMQSHQTTVVATGAGYNIQYAAISANGEWVAYSVPQTGPVRETVWLYDAEANDTYLLFEMAPANGVDYLGQGLSVSADGRYVAFPMRSAPLLGSTFPQVVVVDRTNPSTLMLASTGTLGSGVGIGDAGSSYPKLSDDGRYVLFATSSFNLSAGVALGGREAIVLRDLQTQTTSVASRRANGTPVQSASGVYKSHTLSGDGTLVAVTADEFDMTGTVGAHQIFMTPRP